MRRTMPLTDTEVKNAKPKDKQYKLFDGDGLYLVIKQNGSKLWRVDFTFEGKRKTMSMGRYPILTLEMARTAKNMAKKKIASGINPITERKIETALDETFADIAYRWVKQHAKQDVKQGTNTDVKRRLENHSFPFLGKMRIQDIKRTDIINTIEKIQVNGKHYTAQRLLQDFEKIWKYAVTREIVKHNIIADIDRSALLVKTSTKHMPCVLREKEIKELLRDIWEYGEAYNASDSTINALTLAPYVFLRPANLRMLEWREIVDNGTGIEISGEKMKMKKDFYLPLSTQAQKIIAQIPRESDKYLFPAVTSTIKPLSENTLNHALAKMGWKNKMTSHGWRSIFSTFAHTKSSEHRQNSDVIEHCLAHTTGSEVRQAYDRDFVRKYEKEKRIVVQWYADLLDHWRRRD